MAAFPRTDRLTRKEDFQLVFAASKKVTQANLIALCRTNQMVSARLGIIVAKQHFKLASERNRRRRIVRESFRQHKETLKGLDIVVLIRSEWSRVSSDKRNKQALRDDIDTLWQHILKLAS